MHRNSCRGIFFMIILVGLWSMGDPVQGSDTVRFFSQNFNNNTLGTYQRSEYQTDFPGGSTNPQGMPAGSTKAKKRAYVSGYSSDGGYGLKMRAPAGEVRSANSGFSFKMGFDDLNGDPFEASDVYIKYKVRFLDGFDFQNGGKLPGLGSDNGRAVGGRTTANSPYDDYDDIGWSVRGFFDNVDGASPDSSQGRLGMYVYDYDRPNSTGREVIFKNDLNGSNEADLIVSTNQWYSISIRVVDGTPGQNDGVLRAWIDGTLVFADNTIRWGEDELNPADTLLFHYFFGGSNPNTFAPDNDSLIVIDELKLFYTIGSQSIPEPSGLAVVMGLASLMLTGRWRPTRS